jgi:hypothetical protein
MRLPVSNLCFRRNSEFNSDYQRSLGSLACHPKLRKQPNGGGADRDRTDDLKLAKLALSQLSYGPRDRRSADRRSAAQVGGPGTS